MSAFLTFCGPAVWKIHQMSHALIRHYFLFYRENTKTDTLHHLLIKMFSLSPWLKGVFGGCGLVQSEGQILTSWLDFSTLPLSRVLKTLPEVTV